MLAIDPEIFCYVLGGSRLETGSCGFFTSSHVDWFTLIYSKTMEMLANNTLMAARFFGEYPLISTAERSGKKLPSRQVRDK